MRRKKRLLKVKRIVIFVILLLFVAFLNLPVIYMIFNSFKPLTELMSSNAILPINFTLNNYAHVFTATNLLTYFKNSIIITAFSALFTLCIATCAGYVLARYKSGLVRLYGNYFLFMQIFPLILAIIPLFVLFSNLRITNSHFGVILIFIAMGLPYSIWMFRSYFYSIPVELEEAAWIDGCKKYQAFFLTVLPVAGPSIIAVITYDFIIFWNEFMISNIFLRADSSMTLPVGIRMFMAQETSQWGYIMASATIAMIPLFVLFILFQKYVISGAVTGSIK